MAQEDIGAQALGTGAAIAAILAGTVTVITAIFLVTRPEEEKPILCPPGFIQDPITGACVQDATGDGTIPPSMVTVFAETLDTRLNPIPDITLTGVSQERDPMRPAFGQTFSGTSDVNGIIQIPDVISGVYDLVWDSVEWDRKEAFKANIFPTGPSGLIDVTFLAAPEARFVPKGEASNVRLEITEQEPLLARSLGDEFCPFPSNFLPRYPPIDITIKATYVTPALLAGQPFPRVRIKLKVIDPNIGMFQCGGQLSGQGSRLFSEVEGITDENGLVQFRYRVLRTSPTANRTFNITSTGFRSNGRAIEFLLPFQSSGIVTVEEALFVGGGRDTCTLIDFADRRTVGLCAEVQDGLLE